MDQFVFDFLCLVAIGVLVAIEEGVRRRRAAGQARQQLARKRQIERATSSAIQSIQARYQSAAWTAVNRMLERRTAEALRHYRNPK